MMTTDNILERAVRAKTTVASLSSSQRQKALLRMAEFLRRRTPEILKSNREDTDRARGTISEVMIDRLTLTEARLEDMARGVEKVASLPDPIGKILECRTLPNGMLLKKVSVSIGVIAMIYESRPNVTSDAAALSLMSGNVCVLRGGKEAIRTNLAVVSALKEGLCAEGITPDAIGMIEDTRRESSLQLMEAIGRIDLLIPRGSAGLIRACVENSKVPCIQTGSGLCHIYVDKEADTEKALRVLENAKTSRPSVCNAAEVCLVHRDRAAEFLPKLYQRLVSERVRDGKPPVELRLDAESARYIPGTPASDTDFDTEFLDYILAVKTVSDLEEAMEHIRKHSTGHSESILTENEKTAEIFTSGIDSAAVYINASTRFTDGGEFGFGCEIGISTQKMHVRGPMGLEALTSYKYILKGDGHVR